MVQVNSDWIDVGGDVVVVWYDCGYVVEVDSDWSDDDGDMVVLWDSDGYVVVYGSRDEIVAAA